MAQHITSLLMQPEVANSMGERGRRIVIEKFSSQKQLQNVESLYGELLKLRNLPQRNGVALGGGQY